MRIYFKDPNIRVNPFSAPGLIMRTSFKIGWEISVSLTPCRHKTQCTSRTLHHDLLMSYFCSVSCQFYICTGAFLSFIVRVCRTESSHLFTQWHQKISIKKYFKYFPTVEKARNPMKLKNKTNSFTSFFLFKHQRNHLQADEDLQRDTGRDYCQSAGVQRNRSKCAAHAFMCSRGQFSFLGWIGMISSMTCGNCSSTSLSPCGHRALMPQIA